MRAMHKSEESRTVLSLRRQIRQQDNMIEDLQKTNADLQVELNVEKGLTRMYIDRLRQTEEEWLLRMRTLKEFVKEIHHVLNSHDGARSEVSNVFGDADFNAYFEDALSSGCMEDDFHSMNTLTTSLSTASEKNDDLSTDSSSTEFSIKDSFPICDDHEASTNQQSTPSPKSLSLNNYQRTTTPRALFQPHGHLHRDKVDRINTYRKQLVKKRPLKRSGITPLEAPRLDWAQKLVLLKESFEKKKALFVDDLSFIREVHGGFSLAPEMDIGLEFKTLSKAFTRWKSEFKEQLRTTEVQLKHAVKGR